MQKTLNYARNENMSIYSFENFSYALTIHRKVDIILLCTKSLKIRMIYGLINDIIVTK